MPELLGQKDLEKFSPIFKGWGGKVLSDILLGMFGVARLNRLNDSLQGLSAPDFADGILKAGGADWQVAGFETLQSLEPPFITISNHPYGSVDGIILIDMIGHLIPDYKVMVNKVLSYVKGLEPNFITVTPTLETRTTPTAESIHGVRLALGHIRDGHPLGLFPSGAVSDLKPWERCIRDREWQMPIIRFIKAAKVPVVPIRFFDRNSLFYYLLGLIDWRVRILRLPHEVVNKAGKLVRLGVGKVISVAEQEAIPDLEQFRDFLRQSVYGMPLPSRFVNHRDLGL